jgi:hypothetical protein
VAEEKKINYWQSIKKEIGKAIGSAAGALPKAALNLAGGMAQARVAPITPGVVPDFAASEKALADRVTQDFGQRYVNTLLKPAEVVRADVVFNLAAEEIDKLYTAVRPIVTRPISTALLAEADNISGEGFNFIENWKLAKNVSPGQALGGLIGTAGEVSGITPELEERGVPLPTFLDPTFNIADPDQRKQAFQDEIFGKFLSGGADGLLSWYTDPLVLAGKGLAVGRTLGLDQPIRTVDDIVRLRSELDAHSSWLKSGGTIGRETPMGVIAQRLTEGDAVKNFDDVFVRRTTARNLVADVTGELKTFDEVADFLAAAAGDMASLKKLERTKASIADEIVTAKELLDPIQKRMNDIPWGSATRPEQHLPTIEEFNRLTRVLEDLRVRDASLDKALSENIGDYRVINEFTSAADVTLFDKNLGVAIEKTRAKASEARHNLTFYTEQYQKNPYTRPVVNIVAPFFNKLPRGIVRVDGGLASDSFNEIKYALNSVKELRGIEYAGVKNELGRSYLNARNANERMQAVRNIEEQIAEISALRYDIPLEDARQIYQQFSNMRTSMMSSMRDHGYWVDDTGKLITSPFWKSEMPNVVPMMDFKDFDSVMRLYSRFSVGGEKVLGAAAMARLAGKEVADFADLANSIFKVSVLTRFGYPVRNTIDGQLRTALVLGSMAKTDDYFKNFSKNLKTRAQIGKNFIMDSIQSKNPGELREQTGRLIAQKNGFVDVRNQILDELTPQAYYAGAAGTFGKMVEPSMVELAISSKTKPLITGSKRNLYFELTEKKNKQGGLLFGEEKTKYQRIREEAFGKYIRQEVVPSLPEGTTMVYADYLSGKVFYKVPGTKGRIPKGAFPTMEPRKGIPESMLGMEVQAGKKLNLRAKEPGAQPDIRVITSYDISRGRNYEDIAEIIGEDQMRRVRSYTQQIDNIENEINDKILESQRLAAIRSELKIVRSGEGQDKYVTPKGQTVLADGAFAGPAGMLVRQDAASDRTLNWLTEGQAYLAYDAAKGASYGKPFQRLGTEYNKVVTPTDPQYFTELANFANNRFRKDQLAMRLLKGESDDEISQWLRSKNGKFYLREIDADITPGDIKAHIQTARSRVYKLFPDQQIRSLIAREEMNPQQFDALMRNQPNLANVPGREIMETTFGYSSGAIKRTVDTTISKIFEVIGTTPENNLVSWPFYEKLYKRQLQREVNLAEGAGKNIQDPDLIIQMQRSAHSQALKTTNETLYRVTNNSGLSSTLRFLVPFFNAQYNAVKVYGSLIAKDPSRAIRASMIWNAPNRVATVVDEEGKEVPPGAPPSTPQFMLFTIPEGLQGKFGIPKTYQVSIPKNSLNIFLQGENPLAPAFGIPVTIPVSMFANKRPEVVEDARTWLTNNLGKEAADTVFGSLLPFGRAATNPWDLILPAAARKYEALQAGLSDEGYARAVAAAMKTQRYEWEMNGRVGKEPTFKDAQRLADQLYSIRIKVNLGLPFTFTFRPEWQFIMDDYRSAIADPKVGPTKVDDYILGKYGDIGYILTAPTSINKTGIAATGGAVKNQKEFNYLLGKMDKNDTPGLIGFLANYGVTGERYSDAASNYFRNKEVRPGGTYKYTEQRDIEQILVDREISLGWSQYTKVAQERDAVLAQWRKKGYNTSSINSTAAKQLGLEETWKSKVAQLEETYPGWAKERQFGISDFNKTKRYIRSLTDIASDKKWMDKYGNASKTGINTMEAVSDFLVNRTYLSQELARRKTIGGSATLDNQQNTDLKDRWDNYILNMKLWSNGFADLYDRYLENDNLEVIKP